MQKFSFLLIVSLLPLLTKAQKGIESLLYNEKGQYRMDTTLTISETQYEVWKHAEAKIFADCGTKIAQLLKNEIKKKKIVKRYIVSFDCGENGISNISDVTNSNPTPAEGTAKFVKKHSKDIYKELKNAASQSKDAIKFDGTYYISL